MRTDKISLDTGGQPFVGENAAYNLTTDQTLSPALPGERLHVPATRIPLLWNALLAQAKIAHHPAQLVWVDDRTFGNSEALEVYARNPDVEHVEPPVPSAWCVFSKPVLLGQSRDMEGGGRESTVLLRSVEWSHRIDGIVAISAYTLMVTDEDISDGMVVPVATRPGEGLLQFADAAGVGMGHLITGDVVWPPLFSTTVTSSRKTQRAVAQIVHTLWMRWCNPQHDDYTGEMFLPEEAADSTRSTGKRATGRDVRVVVVGRKSDIVPGEPVPVGPRSEPDHRWTVRGHWRNQPCGPGRRYRRRIWVPEHEAGPPDKPLRKSPTVLAVR